MLQAQVPITSQAGLTSLLSSSNHQQVFTGSAPNALCPITPLSKASRPFPPQVTRPLRRQMEAGPHHPLGVHGEAFLQ